MLCEYNFSSLKMCMLMLETFEDNSVTNILLMNKENCALKLVDEIIPSHNAYSNNVYYTKYFLFAGTLRRRADDTVCYVAVYDAVHCSCLFRVRTLSLYSLPKPLIAMLETHKNAASHPSTSKTLMVDKC